MLIRDAEILARGGIWRGDARVADGRVSALAPVLARRPGEKEILARGALLLPGLHDHHIHLMALAAARKSLRCGPTEVRDAATLAAALRGARSVARWVRGVGYHESVAGELDRAWLDAVVPDVPVRIQHRTGQLWIFNSAALNALGAEHAAHFERRDGRLTGRLYGSDSWLRARLARKPPTLRDVGAMLAGFGITGVTDATPGNDVAAAATLRAAQAEGGLPQHLLIMGDDLPHAPWRGPVKHHLNENRLPDIDSFVTEIAAAHAAGRTVAVHCVTEAELVFTLAAIEAAGPMGDRIEHAGVAPDPLVGWMARLGLRVVTQPHFIAERGDQYRVDVPPDAHDLLYRAGAFLRAGVALAAGSDAPYGDPNPWRSMQAARARRTASGVMMGRAERLSAAEALDLFLAPLEDVAAEKRRVAVGAPADLVLLDRAWREMEEDPASVRARMTVIGGRVVHEASG